MDDTTKAVRAGRRWISQRVVTITVFLVGALAMPVSTLLDAVGHPGAAMLVLPASGFIAGLVRPSLRRLGVVLAGMLAGYTVTSTLTSTLDDWFSLGVVIVSVSACFGYGMGGLLYLVRHYNDPP
jgi:uncharacterized membrane protein AbrB (regulator of aidB expression)